MSVLGTIVGGAVQAGLGAINNVWAQEQQREARRENYIYGEMAAKNADARTRALYNDFYSTEALMKQYKAAGLSPSMMFGGTPGQGGTTGAQGTGAQGPGALYTPISMLEGAQIGLLNAQAEKTKAETKTIEGTNERGEAEISEIKTNVEKTLTEIGLNKIAQNYNTLMVTAQEIENAVASATQDYKVKEWEEKANYMSWLADKTEYEAENEALEYEFNSDTYETRKETINAELENIYSGILRNEFQNKVDQASISKMAADIMEISLNYQVAIENIKLRGLEGKALVLAQKDAANKWRTELRAKVKMWSEELKLEYYKLENSMTETVVDGLFGLLNGFTSLLTTSGATNKKPKRK